MEGQPSTEHLISHKETPRQKESLGRKTVEVNGREWSYLEYGNPEAQPILQLHGWVASAEGDKPLSLAFAGEVSESSGLKTLAKSKPESAQRIAASVRALRGKYHIIDPDLPGMGESQPLKDISIENIAKELVDFQKATDMENAIVFGSSMGGVLGIKLAASNPELVKALVVQGPPTGPKDIALFQRWLSKGLSFGPIPHIFYTLRLAYPAYWASSKSSAEFRWSSKESQDAMLKGFKIADRETAIKTVREFYNDIEKDMNEVECPVIVIDGARAQLVSILKTAESSSKFHPGIAPHSEKIAKNKLVFLPIGGHAGKHGHTIVNTFPEGIAAMIDDVLGKILPQEQKPAA